MELLLILSKETHNSIDSMLKWEFTYVDGLYKTLEKLNKEQKKEYEKQEKAAKEQYNIPDISNIVRGTSLPQMNNIGNGSLNIPSIPQMPQIRL
jgi:hypothetical protein